MRKITSLLMLFFAFVGMAFAQSIASIGSNITDLSTLEEGTYVVLKNVGRNKYIYENSDNKMLHGDATSGKEYIWQVHVEEGGKYSFSSITGKYISTPLDGADVFTVESTADDKDEFTITAHNEDNTKWKLQSTNNTNIYWDGQAARFVGWQGNGANSRFEIIPITLGAELTPITSVDQLSNGKLYTIAPKAAAQRGVLYATSTSTCLDACGAGGNHNDIAVNPTSPDQQFALYTHNDKIYLYSVGAGKFAAGIINDRYFALSEEPTQNYTIVESTTESGYFIIKLDNNNYINVSTGWSYGCVGKWATEDDGNKLVITPVADMSSELSTALNNAFNTQRNFTYTFRYNGDVKATQTCSGNVGEAYPEVDASLFPYGVTATKPEGNIPSDVASNIELELTVGELPFEATEDVKDINKWYFMQMHSNQKKYIEYIADGNYMEWTDTEVNAANRDAYMWAFVGNIWDGFKLVNKAATTANAIKSVGSGNPGMDTFANGTSFVLKRSKVADGNGFVYFCLQYPNGEHLNAQSGKVAHWWDSDAGSAINLFEVPTLDAELAALVGEIEAKNYDSCVGETVGCLTAESVAALNEAIATAKAVQGADADDLVALQDAEHNLKTIQPTVGKFYTIKNAFSNVYMSVDDNGGLITVVNGDTSWGRVFQFVGANNGQFYFMNTERGAYLNTAKAHASGQELATSNNTTNAIAVTIKNLGKANQVSITPAGGATLHHDANYSTVVAWNGEADSRSAWIIEEVDVEGMAHNVTIGEAGWSSLVLGYNATVPTGVTAYAVSAVDGGYATLASVGSVIPAGQAVLLNTETAGEYAFEYAAEAGTITNLLQGTGFNAYIEGAQNTNYYVLSVQEGEVGLYKAMLNKNAAGEEGDTHFKNNANKAYLPMTATQGANMLRFNFGGETTAIDAVEVENANAPIYDLSGRRVLTTVKGGVYIQNGKKFIVK